MLLRPDKQVKISTCVWTPKSHCLELDGVRGLAILLVTVYRVLKEIPSSDNFVILAIKSLASLGEKGVDLFFVLSGFLITSILLETRARKHYFKNFIARRALRIFPLYFFALALFLWILPPLLGLTWLNGADGRQVYLWAYVSNFYMSWTNSWCFGPLDHFWSLAVEEHFYLVWPAVVFFLSPRGLTRFCFGTIVAVGLLRMVASTRQELGVAVNVLTLFRCDALCFGGLLASLIYQWQHGDLKLRLCFESREVLRRVVIALTIACSLSILLTLSGKRWFTLPSTLYPLVWTLALWCLLTSERASRLAGMMRNKSLRWLGRYSYGMYVFQLPLLTILPFSALGTSGDWWQSFAFVAYAMSMFGLISLLAWVSYHGMEKHFLNCRKWFS